MKNHQHHWISGWTHGKRSWRECACGTVKNPEGKLHTSPVREYYKHMASKWKT